MRLTERLFARLGDWVDDVRRGGELARLHRECPPAQLVTSPEALVKLQAVRRGIDKARMVTTGAAYALLTQLDEDLYEVEQLMCQRTDLLNSHDYAVEDLPAGRIVVEPPVYDWVEGRPQ